MMIHKTQERVKPQGLGDTNSHDLIAFISQYYWVKYALGKKRVGKKKIKR